MVTEKPTWLPPVISADGNWSEVLISLYKIFETDIKYSNLTYEDKPIWWDKRVLEEDGYEEGFWHLITRIEYPTKARLFDPRRAERLPWFNPIIKNTMDDLIKIWDYKESNKKIRTYVWFENGDYVIILHKRKFHIGTVAFLVTAFYVDGDSKKRNLRKKFKNRMI